MLNILKTQDGNDITLFLEGRLDTLTASAFEKAIRECLNEAKTLTINMKDLEYISSAGLRVLLSAQKVMNHQGEMIVQDANEMVMEVFEVTGFVDILNLE